MAILTIAHLFIYLTALIEHHFGPGTVLYATDTEIKEIQPSFKTLRRQTDDAAWVS